MDSSYAAVVYPISDTKSWSSYSADRSYSSFNNPNSFHSSTETYAHDSMRASVSPINSFSSMSENDFQHVSGDYAVSSSTVGVKADNMDPQLVTDVASMVRGMMNDTNDVCSEGNWSNDPSPPLDTLYSSNDSTNSDESHYAYKSSPLLYERLSHCPADLRIDSPFWQHYQHGRDLSQQIPHKTLAFHGQLQQSGPFPQRSQFQHYSQFPQSHYQQYDYQQQQRFQQKYQYCQVNTNYAAPALQNYQQSRQQEVFGHGSSVISPSRSLAPVTKPVSSHIPYSATSPSSQVTSSGGSILAPPSRKKAQSRVKKSKLLPSIQNGDETVSYNCPRCDRPFRNKSNIRVHILTHTGEKPYGCGICPKNFRQKAHLQKHMSIHAKQMNEKSA